MENIIQKRAHEVTIYGNLYRVEVGTLIQPDNWIGATRLQVSDWDGAEFYLPSYRYSDLKVVMPVSIRVTGRTFQRRSFSSLYWIRIQIEFKGDGEESTFSRGWMARKESYDA